MPDRKSTRRRFIVATVAFSGLISTGIGAGILRTSSAWAQSSAAMDEDAAVALARMARLLYPHDDIADDVYAEIIDDILAAAASDSAMTETLSGAVTALQAEQDADWFELDAEQQLAALLALQTATFFGAIQAAVQERFYNHASVWEHIGYPGSSVEHGGYVDRGFDDIDWLPGKA